MPRRSNEQIISDLIEEGAKTLAEAYSLSNSLTAAYKKFAGIICDLRKRFLNSKETGPDWRGQTQAYRDVVAKMYEASGVPADSVSNMQAAIRYHIGNTLRERLTPEELAAAGLKAEGPLGRSRTNNSATPPEDDGEWFEDTIETLKSVEDEHPEVIVVDLREVDGGALPLCNKALAIIQTASEIGVSDDNRDAVVAVLDQVLAEAATFRATAQAFQMPAKATPAPAKAAAKKQGARAPASA